MKDINKEIRKLSQSFRYAIRGLNLCIHHERNFRIHICAALYTAVFAWIVNLSLTEEAILCLCFALMMCAELLNTAIERCCDMDCSSYNGHVRDAKDIAAAAVFICALFCVLIAVILFLRPERIFVLWDFFRAQLWAFGILLCSIPLSVTFIFRLFHEQ